VSTTPLWVPLVVAAFGLVSTMVGIVVTQVMPNRRERASWQRDTDREWQREDEALTFEHRRIAYVEFFEALRRCRCAWKYSLWDRVRARHTPSSTTIGR